jgi:hypothetical protein
MRPSFRYNNHRRTLGAAAAESGEEELETLGRRLKVAMADVEASPFYSGLMRLLLDAQPAVDSILCLGVGSFARSYSARCQLALALLLSDALLATAHSTRQHGSDDGPTADSSDGGGVMPRGMLHVYDPVLDGVELEFLARHGRCAVRPRNEEGRIRLEGRCLCLFLHCPRQLYSNLLAANWGPRQVRGLLVLGNSFAALADSLSSSEREATAGWCRVTRIASRATEYTCDAIAGAAHTSDFDFAFANSSLHSFDAASLPAAEDDELWTRAFAPAPAPTDVGIVGELVTAGRGMAKDECC